MKRYSLNTTWSAPTPYSPRDKEIKLEPDDNGAWVRYEDVAHLLPKPYPPAHASTHFGPPEKTTFRDYVISKHGSYPPCKERGTPYDVTVQALADCLAEWVEL